MFLKKEKLEKLPENEDGEIDLDKILENNDDENSDSPIENGSEFEGPTNEDLDYLENLEGNPNMAKNENIDN